MQLSLNFPREPKPKNSSQELNALLAWLRGKDAWTTAKIISEALGFSDRKIRALASESAGFILSGPGCPGYKHILDATSKLEHQAKAMAERAGQIRSAYHKAAH